MLPLLLWTLLNVPWKWEPAEAAAFTVLLGTSARRRAILHLVWLRQGQLSSPMSFIAKTKFEDVGDAILPLTMTVRLWVILLSSEQSVR